MLVNMHSEAFKTMEDSTLIRSCMEPTLAMIRGKRVEVKAEAYNGLTAGQKILILFQIFDGHACSPAEFYWFACDYLAQSQLWTRMKQAMREIGCASLVKIYEEIERTLGTCVERSILTHREITVLDLERDLELRADITRLFGLYQAAAKEAVGQLAQRIRTNPEEFVILEEGD